MWQQIGFGTMLIGVSAVLLWHQRRWEAASSTALDSTSSDRRRRRRRLSCWLIGVVGAALVAGSQLHSPLSFVLFWTAILLLTLTLAGLGIADFWSTREQVRALHIEHRRETERMRDELKAEFERYRAARETDQRR
jgi:sulfite exporter TauE/SafE